MCSDAARGSAAAGPGSRFGEPSVWVWVGKGCSGIGRRRRQVVLRWHCGDDGSWRRVVGKGQRVVSGSLHGGRGGGGGHRRWCREVVRCPERPVLVVELPALRLGRWLGWGKRRRVLHWRWFRRGQRSWVASRRGRRPVLVVGLPDLQLGRWLGWGEGRREGGTERDAFRERDVDLKREVVRSEP